MHAYSVTLALASVAMLLALGSVYLCRVEWAEAINEFSAIYAAQDLTELYAHLDTARRITTTTHRLSAFALGCTLVAAAFVWAATVRFFEKPLYGRRGAPKYE